MKFHRLQVMINRESFDKLIETLNTVVGRGHHNWNINKPVLKDFREASWGHGPGGRVITRTVKISNRHSADLVDQLAVYLNLKGIQTGNVQLCTKK